MHHVLLVEQGRGATNAHLGTSYTVNLKTVQDIFSPCCHHGGFGIVSAVQMKVQQSWHQTRHGTSAMS